MSWIRAALLLSLIHAGARAQAYLLVHSSGAAAGTRLGSAVAGLGDLNGDGVPDYAAGAHFVNGEDGAVRFFSGATGATLLAAGGTDAGEQLGFSLTSAGDLNGDGKADLLVGAPRTPGLSFPGFPPPLYGSIRILSGADASQLRYLLGGDAASGFANGRFGTSVAGGSDVDGDGTPDYIAGAPESVILPGPLTSAGKAAVFSGASGTLLFSIGGTSSGEFLGRTVAILGDVTGDGRAEFVIGSSGIASQGAIRVHSGATGAVLYGITGTSAGGQIGGQLAVLGDQDADGLPDFAIGIPNSAPGGITNTGRVRVFSGATGALIRTFDGGATHQLLGQALADAGDVNGDGVADLAAGGPQLLLPGVSLGPGSVRVWSGATGLLLWSMTGASVGDAFANALGAGGDLDADGFADLLVGAPGLDANGTDSGSVAAFSWTGIPAGSSRLGSGCPGSGGFVPRIATYGGAPSTAGNPGFGIALSRVLGGSTVLFVAGTSSTSWGGVPLPLDLGPLGAPGCFLRVSIDVWMYLTAAGAGPGNGTILFPLPVPSDPGLANLTLYGQFHAVDPGPAFFPGATTPALALTFQ